MKKKNFDYSRFDENQIKLCEIMIESRANGVKLTTDDLAELVGVSPRTIYRWKKNEDFLELYNQQSMLAFKERLPNVVDAMLTKAESGNVKAGELIFKAAGLLKDIRVIEGEVDVNVQALEGASNDDLKLRIAELERKALGKAIDEESIDADFTIVDVSSQEDVN